MVNIVENTGNKISQNLFYVLRFIRRILLKVDLDGAGKGVSRPHLAVMVALEESGTLPSYEICKRLFITKPQLTHLVDRLVNLGIVERLPDKKDRRIINVALTERGKIVLNECREAVKKNIGERLSCLGEEDREEMLAALEKLREIGTKLEQ